MADAPESTQSEGPGGAIKTRVHDHLPVFRFEPGSPELTLSSSAGTASSDPDPSEDEVEMESSCSAAVVSTHSQPAASSNLPLNPVPGPALDPAAQQQAGRELLPRGWRATLPEEQQDWVGHALFHRTARGKITLKTTGKMWWYPPGPQLLYTQPPATADPFFQRKFFLWLPYRAWAYPLHCECKGKLRAAGLYKTVRRVLAMDGWYFMATEYLECSTCKKKMPAWSQVILDQLDIGHQGQFPAVLSYKLACDKVVLGLLKDRSPGNSPSRLRTNLLEQHTRWWMERISIYLSVLHKLQVRKKVSVPQMFPVPSIYWLLAVYVREAMSRLTETKAQITSVFGDILKMDSTKKLTKKLAGAAAGTAAWITNVGNEHGQVLMSVLTVSESDGLADMAAGLMRRYREAEKEPPKVLYVDRDCCTATGHCKTAHMFQEWRDLAVRLDAWHLMRRFARGVTSESHQLYSLFMAKLSFAVYEWDAGDVAALTRAKQSEEGRDGRVSLSAKELARHCRRRTRGAAETERLIQELLYSLWDAVDLLGVHLLHWERMEDIWRTQRRHLSCIQDPHGVQLYTKTGEITKGGVRLPVFRCSRGTASLDSFHLHLAHFIPGTSASAMHSQVYLLEGLMRWNADRARAAVKGSKASVLRCYSAAQLQNINQLTQVFMGKTLVDNYTPPRPYTGELIGVEYLFSQTGAVLQQELDADVPEEAEGEAEAGFREMEQQEDMPLEMLALSHHSELLQGTQGPAASSVEGFQAASHSRMTR